MQHLEKEYIENCVNKLAQLPDEKKADYITKNRFLASQEIFEKQTYYNVVTTCLQINPSLATQENFDIEYKRCCEKVERPEYMQFLTCEYFLKANTKLSTQQNFEKYNVGSLQEEMVLINKKLATQENFEYTNCEDTKCKIIITNSKLITAENYFAFKQTHSHARKLMLQKNPKIATEKALYFTNDETEKLLIFQIARETEIKNKKIFFKILNFFNK